MKKIIRFENWGSEEEGYSLWQLECALDFMAGLFRGSGNSHYEADFIFNAYEKYAAHPETAPAEFEFTKLREQKSSVVITPFIVAFDKKDILIIEEEIC
jgi:hypothetical protein